MFVFYYIFIALIFLVVVVFLFFFMRKYIIIAMLFDVMINWKHLNSKEKCILSLYGATKSVLSNCSSLKCVFDWVWVFDLTKTHRTTICDSIILTAIILFLINREPFSYETRCRNQWKPVFLQSSTCNPVQEATSVKRISTILQSKATYTSVVMLWLCMLVRKRISWVVSRALV